MSRRLYWVLALPLYFLVVLYYLRDANPGSYCAYCGPVPGFWWGSVEALPSPRVYAQHKAYYDWLFLAQYLPVALVTTVCGAGVAPAIAGKMKGRRTVIAGTLTMALLAALAIVSDLTSQFRPGRWLPMFLLLSTYGPDIFIAHLKVFAVPAVSSSFLVLGDLKNRERRSKLSRS